MSKKNLLKRLIQPHAKNEDVRRKEYILNVILVYSMLLCGIASIINIINYIRLGSNYSGGNPKIIIAIFILLGISLLISKKGYPILSIATLLVLYSLPTLYSVYAWGVGVPQSLLTLALIIFIAGMLVSSRFAVFTTTITSVYLLLIGYLQIHGVINPNLDWLQRPVKFTDIIPIVVTYIVIFSISWLSNREITKSLRRAKQSEIALTKERNLLETRVEERTRELKQAQLEKVSDLVRLAEFGHISAGIFHDLINPLTAISLNLEKIESANLQNTRNSVNQAIQATKRMERLVAATKKHLQREEKSHAFSVRDEIEEIFQIIHHKAIKARVSLELNLKKDIILFGNSLKFNQLLSNLIVNAIDAYADTDKILDRRVVVTVFEKNQSVLISVRDFGPGIPRQILSKIFDPFFTTKAPHQGIGMGLAIVKDVAENYFDGTINVASNSKTGTEFTVAVPQTDIKEKLDGGEKQQLGTDPTNDCPGHQKAGGGPRTRR